MSSGEFYERLAIENPRLAVKYMVHLAGQIQEGPLSAKSEAITARVLGNFDQVERACDRVDALREKLLQISTPFFEEHVIIGQYGADGQARAVFDILERPPLNRDYMMSPRA